MDNGKKRIGFDLKRLFVSGAVVLLSCLVTFMTTYNVMQNRHRTEIAGLVEKYKDAEKTDETLEYMKAIVGSYFYGQAVEWGESDSEDAAYRAYAAALNDKYTEYMSPDEYKSWTDKMNGNLVGIGVMVAYDSAKTQITVIASFPGSPAESAGLCKGDIITAVDGRKVSEIGYQGAIDAIKGESGTTVALTVSRDGVEHVCEVERKAVRTLSVLSKLLENGRTGLVSIIQFDETTPEQFENAVESLVKAGATELVFDLRDNPGGDLESVLSVLSYILPKDSTLIRIISKDGEVQTRESDSDHTLDMPMAVLTNGSTASAAELFTSCLRDYEKITVVGTKTYGKGCMQSLFPLPNGGAFKVTTRMYEPPKSGSYHGTGILPDVSEEASEILKRSNLLLIDEKDDNQLQAAISALINNK